MLHGRRVGFAIAAAIAAFGMAAQIQLPNPYRLVKGWPTLPRSMNGGLDRDGNVWWGEVIRVALDRQGNIWVFHRCFNTLPFGAATCVGRESVPPILEFDPSGKLLTSFGEGIFAFPHGFTVDHEGSVWASDSNGSEEVMGLSTKGPNGSIRGQQVFKFSPTGKVLMTLGKAGVRGNGPDTFDGPTGIAVVPNGDIFVTDGHGKNDRVVKFSKDGRFIKAFGHHGSGPGEFDQPHDICFDSQGRLFIADRSNNRIQIVDQEGRFIDAWKQFGRPSGLFVDKNDTLYVTDSETNAKLNPGRKRGIYIGSAKTGSVTAFIPDPEPDQEKMWISGASGIAADAIGNIYAADIAQHRLRKYVKQ